MIGSVASFTHGTAEALQQRGGMMVHGCNRRIQRTDAVFKSWLLPGAFQIAGHRCDDAIRVMNDVQIKRSKRQKRFDRLIIRRRSGHRQSSRLLDASMTDTEKSG
ncbi:hypothetical protein [Georhizobium sp. MAB10]|uniref:hypothetical protein n=1 Tax=Georhizobium sp. MAB10 TaxID=3028319 RepID=UPI003855F849